MNACPKFLPLGNVRWDARRWESTLNMCDRLSPCRERNVPSRHYATLTSHLYWQFRSLRELNKEANIKTLGGPSASCARFRLSLPNLKPAPAIFLGVSERGRRQLYAIILRANENFPTVIQLSRFESRFFHELVPGEASHSRHLIRSISPLMLIGRLERGLHAHVSMSGFPQTLNFRQKINYAHFCGLSKSWVAYYIEQL